MRFFEQLARRSREIDSLVCVGLDPDFRKHRVEDVAAFNRAIIEATAPYAACYKPNIAFYEQFGVPGLRALEATLTAIPSGIPIIGDVKRGDIGNTAEAYARAISTVGFRSGHGKWLRGLNVSPSSPTRDAAFSLCRTSNLVAGVQEQRLANGRL